MNEERRTIDMFEKLPPPSAEEALIASQYAIRNFIVAHDGILKETTNDFTDGPTFRASANGCTGVASTPVEAITECYKQIVKCNGRLG
jgi:hypothetical protein